MATDGDIYGVYHLHHHQQQQQQAAAAAVQVVATKKGHFWPQSNQQYVLGTEHQPIHLGKCLFN
jgi:hypothetical protein